MLQITVEYLRGWIEVYPLLTSSRLSSFLLRKLNWTGTPDNKCPEDVINRTAKYDCFVDDITTCLDYWSYIIYIETFWTEGVCWGEELRIK